MAINFAALAPITTMNPRSNYDLRISRKTEKITLSEAVINRLNLEDNGLLVYAPQGDQVVVSVQPNEHSMVFAGRKGGVSKSRTFKADALYNMLKDANSDEFMFVEQGTHNGVMFYTLEPQGESTSTEEENVSISDDVQEEPQADIQHELKAEVQDEFLA